MKKNRVRILSALSILLVAVLLLPIFATPVAAADTEGFADEVVHLVNVEREKKGLSLLSNTIKELNDAAQMRAGECNVLFSHTRPDGSQWSTVLKEYNIQYSAAGENIAATPIGDSTPEGVVKSWMASKGHRANILNKSFTHIGVGIVEGTYTVSGHEYEGLLWTQEFIRNPGAGPLAKGNIFIRIWNWLVDGWNTFWGWFGVK